MTGTSETRLGDYEKGVVDFFDSLAWVYLSHYLPGAAHRNLVRLLTLSGLDSWCWKSYALHTIALYPLERSVSTVLYQLDDTADPIQVRKAVEQVWDYAEHTNSSVREPSWCPAYLAAFGYTQEVYLSDLQSVYGVPIDAHYHAPWPETACLPHQPHRQLHFVQETVAIMGATAGAIAQLRKKGWTDDDTNSQTDETEG